MLLWYLRGNETHSDFLSSPSESYFLLPVELPMKRGYSQDPGRPSEIYGDTDMLPEILTPNIHQQKGRLFGKSEVAYIW